MLYSKPDLYGRIPGVYFIYWPHPLAALGVTLEQENDEAVLKKAIEGDSEAFGLLYERYVTRIFNYIYYRTGNSADAEDLTGRVFFRALRHIRTYDERGLPFSAWLYRIAHNLVANWHRDNSRRKEIPLDDGLMAPNTTGHPEHEALKNEENENLMRVIRRLPDERQQLLILKFIDHLSNAEIGVIMGRTEGAIKSLYHRTLLTVREDLEAQGSQGLDQPSFSDEDSILLS